MVPDLKSSVRYTVTIPPEVPEQCTRFPLNSHRLLLFQLCLMLKAKFENLYQTTEIDIPPVFCDPPFQYENKDRTNISDSLFSPRDHLAHLAKSVYITSPCGI